MQLNPYIAFVEYDGRQAVPGLGPLHLPTFPPERTAVPFLHSCVNSSTELAFVVLAMNGAVDPYNQLPLDRSSHI